MTHRARLLIVIAALGGLDREATSVPEFRAASSDTVVIRASGLGLWNDSVRLMETMSLGKRDGADEYALGDFDALAVTPTGEIYLLDDGPVLRRYSAQGQFERTLGGAGSGPGEYRQPDGGALGLLPDGRVLVRDPANGRILVLHPDGTPSTRWAFPPRVAGGRSLYVDRVGNVYAMIPYGPRSAIGEQPRALLRYSKQGQITDTLPVPRWSFERAYLTPSGPNGSSLRDIPYSPEVVWTYSPLGYYVGGVNATYQVDLLRRSNDVLRIQRSVPAVAISDQEVQAREEALAASIRRSFPDWSWDGPRVPRTKPAFRDIIVGYDGRIWVVTSQPSRRVASPAGDRVADRWKEPIAFDAYEPDGRFLGTVAAPEGVLLDPLPVFRGDTIWTAYEDEEGVKYVKRYQISRRK
jgi:hypothetical protein